MLMLRGDGGDQLDLTKGMVMVMVRRRDYQGSVFVATRLVNGIDAEDALFAARNAPLMVKILIVKIFT